MHSLNMKHLFLLATVLILTACAQKDPNPFCDNTVIVSLDDKYDERHGSLIISGDTLPAVNNLIIVNDMLIADMEDNNGRLQVFTLDGKRIGKFGKLGRSDNEYTSGMSFIGQPDNRYLYLKDVNKSLIVILDLDSLKDNGKVIYKRTVKSFPRVLNAFISEDSNLIYEHEIPGSYALTSRNIDNGDELWEEILYEPTDDPFSKYHSYMVMNDKKKKIVSAMRFRNQINFLDLDTKERKSFSVKSDNVPDNNPEGHEYYCDIKANDDNIYALFMNQSMEDSYLVEKPMEIHEFDWDGNFIRKIPVSEYIVKIAVARNGNLYGKDLQGNIYKLTL